MEKNKGIISERAYAMLGGKVRFLAGVNVEAAQKLRTRIIKEIRSLETMPERFPFLSGEYIPPHQYRSIFVENWFLIIYQVKGNQVFVKYIADCRQDYEWLIQK